MATTKTPAEKRNDLARQMDEIDLARVAAVRAIFERDTMQTALADLKAIGDPTDLQAGTRFPTADVSALVANLCLPIERAGELCASHEQTLNARLNPAPLPVMPEAAATPTA